MALDDKITRRRFLGLAAKVGGVIALGALGGLTGCGRSTIANYEGVIGDKKISYKVVRFSFPINAEDVLVNITFSNGTIYEIRDRDSDGQLTPDDSVTIIKDGVGRKYNTYMQTDMIVREEVQKTYRDIKSQVEQILVKERVK